MRLSEVKLVLPQFKIAWGTADLKRPWWRLGMTLRGVNYSCWSADLIIAAHPGLGSLCFDEIQRALLTIANLPDAAPLILGRVRRRLVTKFPYSLVFAARGDEMKILAVAHHS